MMVIIRKKRLYFDFGHMRKKKKKEKGSESENLLISTN